MMSPEDRYKTSTLSLKEIEKRLLPKHRKAMREIWTKIKGWSLPVRAYLDALESFEQMTIDTARELFEAKPDEVEARQKRVAYAYGAIAWLQAKSAAEPHALERRKV